jgi:protease secretion system outer membrane protein
MKLRPFGAVLVLVCYTQAAWSMDLLEAFRAAQKNDANILASRAATVAGRERLPQARSQWFPNVSISATQNNNQLESTSANFLGKEQTTRTGYESTNQTLSLRQPLFRTGLMAQYRQAKAQVDDVESTLLQDEQNLAVRVGSAYFEALLTNEQLALVLAQRATYTTQLDIARKALSAGSGTRTDIDEAQARLDMNVALEIEARQNVAYTAQQLETLVNMPVPGLATLDVTKLQLDELAPHQLHDWTIRAEARSPQLQSLKAQLEAARQEVDKASSGHHPTLDAVAQWTNSTSENVQSVKSKYTNAIVGVQLNIPLFAGGYVSSTVRQALATVDRAEQALEAGRRDLSLRVHKEYRGALENIPKIRALEQALRSANQLVISSQKSLQAGNRTVVDVLNAEQQRTSVLRDLAQARYIYLLSKIKLAALAGDVTEDLIVGINQLLQAKE